MKRLEKIKDELTEVKYYTSLIIFRIRLDTEENFKIFRVKSMLGWPPKACIIKKLGLKYFQIIY